MASLKINIVFDTSALVADLEEVLRLYGDGFDVPDDLKRRCAALDASMLDDVAVVEWAGTRGVVRAGGAVTSILKDLRVFRGAV